MQKTHTSDKDQSRRSGTQGIGTPVILSARTEPFDGAQGKLRGVRRNKTIRALPTGRQEANTLPVAPATGSRRISAGYHHHGEELTVIASSAKQSHLAYPHSILSAFKTNRAFALVISLGLVALIMIVTINLTRTMITSTRFAADIEQTTEAYYAAEAALAMGLLKNEGKGPGYEARVECNSSGVCTDQNGDNSKDGINYTNRNGAYATWTIQGKAGCQHASELNTECVPNPDVFYVPVLGSGTAGTLCDPLRGYPDINHACNWNKILYGENITIPLYRVIEDGDTDQILDKNSDLILNPSELGVTEFKIKVRTPCKDGSNEEGCERYELYIEGNPNFSDTMMIWEITGTCVRTSDNVEKECYLGQIGDEDIVTNKGKNIPKNSEIYADLINNSESWNYVVVDEKEWGEDNFNFQGKILNFLKNIAADDDSLVNESDKIEWDWNLRSFTRPFLNLSVIQTLIDADDPSKNIPYLEYQIETTADAPASDVYQTIIGEGFSGNFKQSVEMKRGYETGVLKFVIQN